MKPFLFVVCLLVVVFAGVSFYGVSLAGPNVKRPNDKTETPTDKIDSPGSTEIERNCWSYRVTFMSPTAGSITAVEKDSNVVTLDLGSKDSIGIEDRLAIWREDNFQIGWLTVTSVESNSARATANVPVEVGDRILKDTTMLVSQTLVSTKLESRPKALAKKHVDADLELGIQRILFFGKPVFCKEVRRDEASGLPMSMNGGCCVSESLVEFTEEYNRLMRQAHKTECRCEG